jgi:hypothetical protein
MKNKIYMMLFCLFISFFGNANAISGDSSGKITRILWWEGHTGVLVQQEGMSDLAGCGRADYYILDDQYPFFKETYALILSAYVTSQPLSLHLDGCVQGLSRIKHVWGDK